MNKLRNKKITFAYSIEKKKERKVFLHVANLSRHDRYDHYGDRSVSVNETEQQERVGTRIQPYIFSRIAEKLGGVKMG